jgi:hypothetical protein
MKRKSWQDEWKSSGKPMATVKPNIRSTEGLARRQQVVLSRLRMGHTNITQAHRLVDDPKPYCNECEQDLTVWHLLWQCRNFNTQRTKNNKTTESLKDDKKGGSERGNLLRETGLIYQI